MSGPAPAPVAVFDLDGTLVDSLADLHGALADVLAEHGRRRLSAAEVRQLIGDGARRLVETAWIATGGLPPPERVDAVVRRFLDVYGVRATERTAPFEGIPAVLDRLVARGVRVAVCTNKPRAPTMRILDATGLLPRFAAVVAGDDLPARKPDPLPLVTAIARAGGDRAASVIIGDGRNDVLAGRAAGVRTIAVGWGYGDASALGADVVVNDVLALAEVV